MTSFQISATQVNVNVEEGTVILTGVDLGEIVGEVGATDILDAIDFSNVHDYVIERLNEDRDE